MHIPVMLKQINEYFSTLKFNDALIIDCTLGNGGHFNSLIEIFSNRNNIFIALDQNKDAIDLYRIENNLTMAGILEAGFGKYDYYHNVERTKYVFNINFEYIDIVVEKLLNIELIENNKLKVGLVFADIGFSTDQLESNKGFSYKNLDNLLDMRMSEQNVVTAEKVIKILDVKTLSNVFSNNADLRDSYFWAKKIKEDLKDKKIILVKDLVNVVEKYSNSKFIYDNLQKIFQALRIFVNRELDVLDLLVQNYIKLKNKSLDNSILAILTFHSGEEKVFKKYIKNGSLKELNAILPSETEILENSKSHSAKFKSYSNI